MFTTIYDEDEKLWHSPETLPLYNPKLSMAQVLFNAMDTFGPKIAQISDNNGLHVTFNEMKIKTIRVAQNLQARGYKSKDIFCIIAQNSDVVAPITFASFALGSTLTALDPSFGAAEMIHMLNITKPVLIFSDITCHAVVSNCLKELGNQAKIFTIGGSADGSDPIEELFNETNKETQFLPTKVNGVNDIVAIVCSSGSTTR